MAWGNVISQRGVGMGCTLIRRAALEQVSFRLDSCTIPLDDWIFAQDGSGRGCAATSLRRCLWAHMNEKLSLWPGRMHSRHFMVSGAYLMI